MKLIFSTLLLAICLGCSGSGQKVQNNLYEKDFKTVFQASLSSLKDRKFTIKSYDWNSGEIDGYRKYQEGEKRKEVGATVSLEQVEKQVKVRIRLQQSEGSAPVPKSELESMEREFYLSLDEAVKLVPRK
jgi:hypothetical protein